MPKYSFVSDDRDYLVFHRPRDYQILGNIGAIGCAFIIWMFYVSSFVLPPAGERDRELLAFLPGLITIFGFFGFGLWSMLYYVSPFLLRFDVRQHTDEIRDGFFPFRRTERGTTDDIECIHVEAMTNQGRIYRYQVRLRWKKRGWRRRRYSILAINLRSELDDAEPMAREYAQMLGVPLGPTTGYPRRRIRG